MTNLDQAISQLKNHSIVLIDEKEIIISDQKGIIPLLELINSNKKLENFSIADKVVGKAVAILILKANIKNVYAKTLSVSAKNLLEKRHVNVKYSFLVDVIKNKDNTDICPMERAVENIDDVETGYRILKEKVHIK